MSKPLVTVSIPRGWASGCGSGSPPGRAVATAAPRSTRCCRRARPWPCPTRCPTTRVIADRAVLVAGGAGAVGNVTVALARRGGARVIATVSGPDKAALATAAGAHAVVNYLDADAVEQVRAGAPGGVDRIVELALGANLELDLAVLAPLGTIATYADDALADLPVRRLMVANATLRFVLIYGLSDVRSGGARGWGRCRGGAPAHPAGDPVPAGGGGGRARRRTAGNARQGAPRSPLAERDLRLPRPQPVAAASQSRVASTGL